MQQRKMQQRMFSRRRLLLRVVAFGLAVICAGFFARFAQAQLTNGSVVGTVTDTSGAVIPGANVTLTNTGTHIAASMMTNGTGDYTFNLLNPGQYTVTVEAKGFKKLVILASPWPLATVCAKTRIWNSAAWKRRCRSLLLRLCCRPTVLPCRVP